MSITMRGAFVPPGLAQKLQQEFQKIIDTELELQVTEIQIRTHRGLDADNKSFKKYTPKYEKFRADKGRGTTPDLLFTGRMLGSMISKSQISRDKIKGFIRFSSVRESLKADGNRKKRNFFDFTLDFKDILSKKIKEAFTQTYGR